MVPLCPEGARGSADLRLRYEDVTQDGRLQLYALCPGLGVVWRELIDRHPIMGALRRDAVLPILRRLVLDGEGGPISVHAPVRFEGTFQLARERDGDRLFLLIWVEATAATGHTFAPLPGPDAPRHRVGRIFAEHVLTRPFGSKEDRKVTRLLVDGEPEVPEHEHVFESAEALREAAVACAGRAAISFAPEEITFGMMHTDSNQHVNSLVYPRLVEEALLRRLVTTGQFRPDHVARHAEMRWRKPFFAGERARLELTLHADGASATAALYPASAGADDAKPNATITLTLG